MKGVPAFLGTQEAPVRDSWIVGFNGQGPSSGAADAAKRFLRGARELPSAFVCGNDEDALHLIQVAERLGIRIPVDHPSFRIGEKAANILLDKIFH
jgi:DNA-binding LacI/PurR family transcriptional regulator